MTDLKDQLIKLGNKKKGLRTHLQPILKALESNTREAYRSGPWGKWSQVREMLGATEALSNLMGYVGDHESREQFEQIARMWDLPVEVESRDRAGTLLRKFERHFRDTDKLADEFAQGLDKRLLEKAVEDIIQMYDLHDFVA